MKPHSKSASPSRTKRPVAAVNLRAAARTAITVAHLATPPRFVKPKPIHPRLLLPLIREGAEREFHSLTPETFMLPRAMAAAPAPGSDEIALLTHTELTQAATGKTSSNVGEPSTALNQDVVVYTGNWYAAVSLDKGRTFDFIDPASAFPDPSPVSQFCCDQVVLYLSKIDTFVWLLQYGPRVNNVQRLAFATTADVVARKWRLFDITTAALNVEGAFLDFPDLAASDNNLYVTTNIFGPGTAVGSAVLRIPFSGIVSGQIKATPFVSTDFQSFRVAQNCGPTAFFAAHENTSTLKVFSWDEGKSVPVGKSVGVARWIGGNGYVSRTPDGRRWLDRADPRITGATMANNEVWFAWSVDRGSNHRANAFIQIARIDAPTLTLLDNINVFDSNNATCYGALSSNSNGEVGISYMAGGKTMAPSHVVGILGIAPRARKDIVVAKGDRGPVDPDTGKGEWGDYLACRRAYPDEKLFVATGFTMNGPGDGSNTDATPHFVLFGRAADAGAIVPANGAAVTGIAIAPDGGGDSFAGAGPAGDGGALFNDVNQLPVVNDAIATKIKAAAVAEGNQPTPIMEGAPLQFVESPLLATKPGVERWPVKTGTDSDVGRVGGNVINGENLGAGIVPGTVEELIRIGRPPGMRPAAHNFDNEFHDKRLGVVEQTVFVIEAEITVVKLEGDGDYHLVVRGASGETMIAECPTPTTKFLGTSPWLKNIETARQKIDDKIVNKLSPADFVQLDDKLVPREALPASIQAMARPAPKTLLSFVEMQNMPGTSLPTFKTKITPTKARITGPGFFDKVHDQLGVSTLNGIEIHPVLNIEWI
jgi:hypothetical protein